MAEARVRIWSEVPEAPGVADTDVSLRPSDVPDLISREFGAGGTTSIAMTRDDGRIVHYEPTGDW